MARESPDTLHVQLGEEITPAVRGSAFLKPSTFPGADGAADCESRAPQRSGFFYASRDRGDFFLMLLLALWRSPTDKKHGFLLVRIQHH